MGRLLFLLGLVAVLIIFINWLFRQPPKVHWQLIVTVLAVVLLLLVITGRAHWLTAVFAAMLPFLRALVPLVSNLPLLKRIMAGIGAAKSKSQPSSGQTSSVQSKFIRMTLEHDSGDMDGEILEGLFKGQMLSDLGLEQLLQLLDECQQDAESTALLQAYLDRVYEDEWRQEAGTQRQKQTDGQPGEMSNQEALDVLGLSPGASEKEIIEAHRRLMQKLHPDRGGSDYLAATINLAKKTLLDE
jgi:hypothetical protein